MPGRWRHVGRRAGLAAAGAAIALVLGIPAATGADDTPPPPVGLAWGRAIFAPSLTFGYLYDTNLFLQPSSNKPQPDGLMTAQPAFTLTVPFKNSQFRLTDTLLWRDYAQTVQVAGKWSNDAEAALKLVFGSHDIFDASAHAVAGIAETTSFDPGGEVVFRGESFAFHTEVLSLQRYERGARGYRLSLQRNALKFDSTGTNFFNYRGFDGEVDYLEPVGPNTSVGAGYIGTRYDHFDTSEGADPHAVFRKEAGDTALLLLQGWLSPRQPYHLRLGYEHLGFTGGAVTDFRGIVGLGDLIFVVGGGSIIQCSVIRQPYRSFFGRDENNVVQNNFYIYNEGSVRFHRPFQRGSDFGMTVRLSQTNYTVPVFAGAEFGDLLRRDRTGDLELYGNLAVRERVSFHASIKRTRRYSNFPGSDFASMQFFGGFVFGWL